MAGLADQSSSARRQRLDTDGDGCSRAVRVTPFQHVAPNSNGASRMRAAGLPNPVLICRTSVPSNCSDCSGLEGLRRDIERSAAEVKKMQRSDGGWAQLDQLAPDAYATGIAMYALAQYGMSPQDAIYRRGVDYLLSTQLGRRIMACAQPVAEAAALFSKRLPP